MNSINTIDRKVIVVGMNLGHINSYKRDIDIAEKKIVEELKDKFSESYILNIIHNEGLSTEEKMSIFFKELTND